MFLKLAQGLVSRGVCRVWYIRLETYVWPSLSEFLKDYGEVKLLL